MCSSIQKTIFPLFHMTTSNDTNKIWLGLPKTSWAGPIFRTYQFIHALHFSLSIIKRRINSLWRDQVEQYLILIFAYILRGFNARFALPLNLSCALCGCQEPEIFDNQKGQILLWPFMILSSFRSNTTGSGLVLFKEKLRTKWKKEQYGNFAFSFWRNGKHWDRRNS